MNNSLLRICLVLFSSFILINFTLDDVFADEKEITSQSFSFENTSIIEFTNNGLKEIKTIRIWLDDSSFISLKTENGWSSSATPEKIIIFETSEPIKTNEVVKFGIKTEKSIPLFHWKVFDKKGNQIEIGKTQSQTMPSFTSTQDQSVIEDRTGIISESTFKVIPKNPHLGSTIRVTGDHFVPNSSLELFLGDKKLYRDFEIDDDGHFVLTVKIPKNTKAEQVNLILKDKQNNEKTIILSLADVDQNIPKNIVLTVSETENEFFRTDRLEFSGTANPDTSITIKIKNPQGNLFSTQIKNTDSQGNWSASIYFPFDALLGNYSAEITDGKTTINDFWDVVMSKKIHISPTKLKFKSEEVIKFNGTADPGQRIQIKFVDPQGNEVLSNNFIVNTSGFFEIEYPTISSSSKGTYVLYAFQEHETDIVFVGLDQYPQKTLSAKLNKLNYHSKDVAMIGITGKDSQNLTLLIIDQSGNEKFSDNIKLGPDGKRNYELNLIKFPTGIYTLSVSMGSFQTSEVFTVGLQSSSMTIDLDIIKKSYNPGQSIHLMGISEPNTTVDLLLIDPDGFIINKKESFINNNGDLLMNDFIIPYDVTFGKWFVRAESDFKFTNLEFQVNPSETETLSIRVTDILSSSIGKFVTIEGFVTGEQSITIFIEDPHGNIVFQTNVRTTESGEFDLLWKARSVSATGTYYVIVVDSFEKTTSTTFDL